jgi:hypothetical protein
MGQPTAPAASTTGHDKDDVKRTKPAARPDAQKTPVDLAYGCVDWFIYESAQLQPNRTIN